MNLSPIDTIPAIALFFVYFKSKASIGYFADLEAKEIELQQKKKDLIAQNNWNADIEAAHEQYLRAILKASFPWIGKRSFAGALCGSVVSLAFGATTLPGFLCGILITSPKLWGVGAALLGTLFGNRGSGV